MNTHAGDIGAEVAALLDAYVIRHPDEAGRFAHLRHQLASADDIALRSNMRGHLTASGVVLHPSRRSVLMIHHRALDLWLAPGGHYEAPGSLWDTARREVAEETGVSGLVAWPGPPSPFLLDADTHAIPARPARGEGAHWHHDFAFLAVAPGQTVLVPQADEVHEARWTPLEDLQRSPDERVRRVGRKLLALLARPE